MRALILASGRGSRLGDLTSNQPKCFTEVAGKRLIDWQRESLGKGGIQNIAITTGYFSDSFNGLFQERFHNADWADSNMVYSLMQASSLIADEGAIVSYSDIIYSADAITRLSQSNDDIAIAYDPNWLEQWQARYDNPLDDAESFSMDQGYLTDIGRRVNSLSEINGQYMGLLKFTPAGWHIVSHYLDSLSEDARKRLDMTSLLQQLIQQDVKIGAVAITDEWVEVDTPQDLEVASLTVPDFSWT
ncbi:sugar phosphate nucleotidyltransferase [Aliagarivorans marinus]|uniref:phosphocholine cytidylyltransferase family protein n=1 Tax=Aliagarivorans marinus TaxID=561965 RepID=UPI00054FD425|nr:phosphocholine cytidylyltransferase family protein [Aliagarivorans marinus]